MNIKEGSDLTGKLLLIDARRHIGYFYGQIGEYFEEFLENAWHIIGIEGRSELLCEATLGTRTDPDPRYAHKQTLATFEIIAIERGPLERIVDGEVVAIARRKMRCKAELADDGQLRITECDVD